MSVLMGALVSGCFTPQLDNVTCSTEGHCPPGYWCHLQTQLCDGSSRVVRIAAGGHHTCARRSTGQVRCWGASDYGQLGYGNRNTVGDDEHPAMAGDVPIGRFVSEVRTGWQHTCVRLDTDQVRCWGAGDRGRLGQQGRDNLGDDLGELMALGDIALGGDAVQIAAGIFHTCALLRGGGIRCWGSGDNGALGYGNTEDIGDDESPAAAGNVAVIPMDSASTVAPLQIAVGGHHTCVLLDDNTVRCWGLGAEGRLGQGHEKSIGDDESPADAVAVNVGGMVTQIAAGWQHTCALLQGGAVRCWGQGTWGQLGYGNTDHVGDDESPLAAGDVDLGGIAVELAAGEFHTCARLQQGQIRCWGRGNHGQLGYGHIDSIGDDEVPAAAGAVNIGGPAVQITAGSRHTCALLATGQIRCWGQGGRGQLGYGDVADIGADKPPYVAGEVDAF